MFKLFPDQDALVADLRSAFLQHRRVLGVAPTGFGKTVVFAYIVASAAALGRRVIIVAHRSEIVEQVGRALDGMGVRHGWIMPGHRMTADPVQIAMVQTLARRLDQIAEPDLLVIDEAHHGVAGTWQTVSSAWSKARILGVTATPRRLDGRGLGAAFDIMVTGPSMADLIAQNRLAGFRYLAPPQQMDLSAVTSRAGDFAIDELADIMDRSVITGDAVQHYRDHLDRKPAIAFCVTVDHAKHVAAQFVAAGYRASAVDGKMDKTQRRALVAALGNGNLDVLTSCDLISEGVDVPVVAGAILLRPTKSLSMFLQQVGRCLRIKPDGSRATILDHVGNVHRFGMPDAERDWTLDRKPKKSVVPGLRVCDMCFRAFQIATARTDAAGCEVEKCGMLSAAPPKPIPDQVAGTLALVSASPDWAMGINLVTARGDDWKQLLGLAKTDDQLREIATARGYKAQWVFFVRQQRNGHHKAFAPRNRASA